MVRVLQISVIFAKSFLRLNSREESHTLLTRLFLFYMANGKKSFVLYTDYIQIFEQLTDNEAGILIKHLFSYVNDTNPVLEDRLLKILFEPIKQQLKRDLKKWEHKREKLSEAGKASANKRQQMSTNVEQPEQSEADPTVTATVNVTATVIERETTPAIYTIEHCLIVAMNDDRWVTKNKATEKDLKEFNRLLERRGVYTKTPMDYKQHFANWKLSGKKENSFESQSTAPKLRTIT